jgi:hypothetical protein
LEPAPSDERLFVIRNRRDRNGSGRPVLEQRLAHGSVFVMRPGMQSKYIHELVPEPHIKTGRINVTMRLHSPDSEADDDKDDDHRDHEHRSKHHAQQQQPQRQQTNVPAKQQVRRLILRIPPPTVRLIWIRCSMQAATPAAARPAAAPAPAAAAPVKPKTSALAPTSTWGSRPPPTTVRPAAGQTGAPAAGAAAASPARPTAGAAAANPTAGAPPRSFASIVNGKK